MRKLRKPFLSSVLEAKITPSKLETPCWEWQGSRDKDGYGISTPGRAHRKSYEKFIGPIPEKLCVLHRCDNPPCINPDHLFVGTHKDNKTDCMTKGRHAYGEQIGNSKLTENQVTEIRYLFEVENLTTVEIARQFGINNTTVGRIAKSRVWQHLGKAIPARGNRGNSHLTENQVMQIKFLINEDILTQKEIGEKFGVSQGLV